jgi:hypothetical protein
VQKGEMIQKLFRMEEMLPGLLRQRALWRSLDVDFNQPRVERVWAQVNDLRVSLHRIHPCDDPLFHGHPWPCAVRVSTGSYEMAVGYGPPGDPPPEAATILIGPGSVYEMADMDSWHYVTPIGSPSLSLMVSGRPWGLRGPVPDRELGPLTPEAASEILGLFRRLYPGT